MYDRLAALYAAGRIDATGIATAVTRGWITQAQADQITG